MKKHIDDFAYWGGEKMFAQPLYIEQVNLPSWEKVANAFRGIFERRYFANHGPLVRELSYKFAEFVGAKHAVCVANGTVAFTVLAKALDLTGEIIVPAYMHPSTAHALTWANLTPVLCDVDKNTQMITPETIDPHLTSRTSGILAVHLWGQACIPEVLQSYASSRRLTILFDARHSAGCSSNSQRIGNYGAGEVFSFHASKILNGAEGGCITTNDSSLADKIRTIRNFHPSETFAQVTLRINGKMSEAQAGLALLSLNDFSKNVSANYSRFVAYRLGLSDIPGVSLLKYDPNLMHNYQYIVIEIDEKIAGVHRDIFLKLLSAENIICRRHFYPGVHNMTPYSKMTSTINSRFPITDSLCQRCLQLPNSQIMTEDDVYNICRIIKSIQQQAGAIKSKMDDQS
jgi:dTDP-4-amino-4,6-dideoxygalactose transaminase